MTFFNVFICNDLINKLNILKHKPIQIQVAYTHGQLYNYQHLELPHTSERIERLAYNIVFGYGLTFTKKQIKYVLSIIDAYNMCSMYKYNLINPNDISQRVCIDVYVIDFNSFDDFCSYKYTVLYKTQCYSWFVNNTNKKVLSKVKNLPRIKCGISQHILKKIKEWHNE